MGLRAAVEDTLAPGGPLAHAIGGFSPRLGQIQMAVEVARTMEDGGVLVVEAGTGIGKTFAYLVPALLSGERVLLSTATKTLQDQLFGRDIPRLTAALGLAVRVAVLKGRSSYLCTQRMEWARQMGEDLSSGVLADLALVEAWSAVTRSGDLAEIPKLDERSSVVPLVTSTRENCWGSQCPKAQQCHVNLARREAMSADVVVINHHLFFADLHVRESGVAELLPSVRSVVFDEAHQLNEIGVQFLGRQLSTTQLAVLCRDLMAVGPLLAQAGADWSDAVESLRLAAAKLRAVVCGVNAPDGRRAWSTSSPAGIEESDWSAVLMQIHAALQQIDMHLRARADGSPELNALAIRTRALTAELDHFANPLSAGHVRWVEGVDHVRLVQSPLDIAYAMQQHLAMPTVGATDSHHSWIFTSATLGHDAGMGWFLESCGLQGAHCLQIQSPFDYATQSALYIPADMPLPNNPLHGDAVAALTARAARVLGGRVLVLTTTLRAMRAIGECLRGLLSDTTGMQILVQGELTKRELMQRFLSTHSADEGGAVLVASTSFWEGIDVAGDALQLVVVDKIPFAPPDDPLVEARAMQLKAAGKNAFMHLHVPHAALALKQGAGRLIRTEHDRGILVVCDVRLNQKGYGRKILASLPAMQRLETEEAFALALDALTRPSTTGQCSA